MCGQLWPVSCSQNALKDELSPDQCDDKHWRMRCVIAGFGLIIVVDDDADDEHFDGHVCWSMMYRGSRKITHTSILGIAWKSTS